MQDWKRVRRLYGTAEEALDGTGEPYSMEILVYDEEEFVDVFYTGLSGNPEWAAQLSLATWAEREDEDLSYRWAVDGRPWTGEGTIRWAALKDAVMALQWAARRMATGEA